MNNYHIYTYNKLNYLNLIYAQRGSGNSLNMHIPHISSKDRNSNKGYPSIYSSTDLSTESSDILSYDSSINSIVYSSTDSGLSSSSIVTPVVKISVEYAQWKLSSDILRNLLSLLCNAKKCSYEIKNIYERFLLCIANNKSPAGSNDGKIFYELSDVDSCIIKMIKEFSEKKTYFKEVYEGVAMIDLMKSALIDPINEFVRLRTFDEIEMSPIVYGDETITFKTLTTPISSSILKAIKSKKIADINVANMLLRYNAMMIGGQQWGVPFEVYDDLHNIYGTRYEGFASPLNSRMIRYNDGKFCSLFYDTDKYFGSIGSFFSIDLLDPMLTGTRQTSHWTVNPPYTEKILHDSAKRIIDAAKNGNNDVGFMSFYIMPGWYDSEAYKLLHNNKYTKYEEVLRKYEHVYEYQNKLITATFDSLVFIVDSYDYVIDYSNICKNMKVVQLSVHHERKNKKGKNKQKNRGKRWQRV